MDQDSVEVDLVLNFYTLYINYKLYSFPVNALYRVVFALCRTLIYAN